MKRGRPRKSFEPNTKRSHVARFLDALLVDAGTQQKLVAKTGAKISRPLLAQIVNGRAFATVGAVSALCRACTREQAHQLLCAHLFDELERVAAAYKPLGSSGWDGSVTGFTMHFSIPTPLAKRTAKFTVDPANMQLFQFKD